MSIPYKVIEDIQLESGRLFIFDKNDPRIETLKLGDIINTENGCWKLISYDSAQFYLKKQKKKNSENYRAFSVQQI